MDESTADKPVLAIDLGGSKIAVALVSPQGAVIAHEYTATLAEEGPDAVISRMLVVANGILARAGIDHPLFSMIVIATAGIVDTREGIVTTSPNLPGWHDVPLRRIVDEQTGLRSLIINDASAAVLGEHYFGAGRGVNNLLYVTVSTGIGGGILINGKLYDGILGGAGEVGHMIIDVDGPRCKCGNTGCLEAFASGKALAREAQKHIANGKKSIMFDLVEGEPQNITAKTVSIAAQKGDALALDLIAREGVYLGIGMVNLINIFNPEMIIIGGGMAQMGDMLLDPVRKVVDDKAFQLPAKAVQITTSQLGDHAGTVGAAVYLLQTQKAFDLGPSTQ